MSSPRCAASRRAFTIMELTIAAAMTSAILLCVTIGAIALRRSFEMTDFHVTAQNEQLRVFDYVGRDLRTASVVTVANSGTRLDLLLPVEATSSLASHIELPVAGTVQTGAAAATPVPVSYYREGDRLIRERAGVKTEIARTVTNFRASRSGSAADIEVTFSPRYSL